MKKGKEKKKKHKRNSKQAKLSWRCFNRVLCARECRKFNQIENIKTNRQHTHAVQNIECSKVIYNLSVRNRQLKGARERSRERVKEKTKRCYCCGWSCSCCCSVLWYMVNFFVRNTQQTITEVTAANFKEEKRNREREWISTNAEEIERKIQPKWCCTYSTLTPAGC